MKHTTREVEDVNERIRGITPEAKARVLDEAAALVAKRGHEIDAWGTTGPLCVTAAVWTAATGNPFGRAPGYEGERARELGAEVLRVVDECAEYCDVEAWELVDKPGWMAVVKELRFMAQHVREVAAEERAARRARAVVRRERLGVAA